MVFLFLLLSIARAETAAQNWTPWPSNGMTYAIQSACPAPCYPIVQADGSVIDVTTATLSGGKLVVDAVKKAAKDAAIAQAAADVKTKQDQIAALILKAKAGTMNAAEVQSAIQIILERTK